MLTTLLLSGIKALTGIAIILFVWLLIQAAWRRMFPGARGDEDALEGRVNCHGCSCLTPCQEANQKENQWEG